MTSREESKGRILRLVNNFVENKNKFEKMKETDIRNKLIDPLFESLGWDIDGKEIPDEVIREETVRTGKTKFIDYTFRINGVTKFVVEAKAISEDLDNSTYIKQVIEYAYNKACLWAVLTDFEGIKIFLVDRDYSETPFYNINLDNVSDFDKNFELLWKFLSREGVISGELENEAKIRGQLKDKVPIDKQLLDDLMIWRKFLSDDIKTRYSSKYDEETIDEIVQRIIDRLIFIRKTEDMQIEDRILDQITRREDKYTYGEVKKLFEKFNDDYNSKLFGESFGDKHECDMIDISNNVIRKVIKGFYVPTKGKIEYNFAVIDADILGNIYEQYLSFILKKAGKGAKLVGGKAHRKEQGIYYTPTYIVDYIVRNTLGEMLKNGKNPDDIKILDPACGSGSFLLKAFDYLDNYYNKKFGKEKQATLENIEDGLFTRRIKILKNNIFGVDLDTKAVEIAQLNLLLKIAEKRGRLPTLKENIKCGNSLISSDEVSDRAFKWEKEFAEISKNGGFDIVIENPPYGAELNEADKHYLKKEYKEDKTGNTAAFFILKSLSLLREGGYMGLIVPKQLTYISSWDAIRKKLLEFDLTKIIDVSEAFPDVELEQVIFIIKKTKEASQKIIVGFSNNNSIEEHSSNKSYFSEKRLPLWITEENHRIFDKILKESLPLRKIANINWGAPSAKYLSREKTNDSIPCLRGREIQRYNMLSEHFIKRKHIIPSYYVKDERLYFQRIVSRYGSKIIGNYRNARLVGTYSKEDTYADKTVTMIWNSKINLKFLLGILNSKLISWFSHRYLFNRSQLTMEFMYDYARNFPIRLPTKEQESKLSNLVDKILSLNKQLNTIKGKRIDEKNKIEEKIKEVNEEINEFVYSIYNVTDNEKEIIEKELSS